VPFEPFSAGEVDDERSAEHSAHPVASSAEIRAGACSSSTSWPVWARHSAFKSASTVATATTRCNPRRSARGDVL
jgi:hypothetical protein